MQRLVAAVAEADDAVRTGRPADAYMAELFKQNRSFGSKTRRLIANSVFSYFRWRGWVLGDSAPDYARSMALAHALDASELDPLIVYWSEQQNSPGFALSPVGPLALADKAHQLASMAGLSQPPADDVLVPAWSLDLLATPPGLDLQAYRRRVLESIQTRPSLWLRFTGNNREAGLRELRTLGYAVDAHPALPCAATTLRAISREHSGHRQTATFEIQDLSSQCVGLIANPQPGEKWWDVCAGSGGKTLHLADLLQGQGHVCATEIRANSLRELQRRAGRAGVTHTIDAINTDGLNHAPDPLVDGALVDAPCSGMGTWSRSPDARWRMPRQRVGELAALQAELLAHTARYVRPGGVLVYAVCTLTACETTEQVRAFDSAHPDFELIDFQHPVTRETVQGQAWIHPWDGPCGAMFIAKWRRRT